MGNWHAQFAQEQAANAAFIVRAVNNFEALCEALKELLVARHSSLEVVGRDPITGDALNREGMAAVRACKALHDAGVEL